MTAFTVTVLGASTGEWIAIVVAFAAAAVLTVAWLWMAFDLVVRKDLGGGAKLLWFVGWIFLAPFALVAYLLFGRRRQPAATA